MLARHCWTARGPVYKCVQRSRTSLSVQVSASCGINFMIIMYQYWSRLHKAFNRPKGQDLVLCQGMGRELPHLLNPGAHWTGRIDQDEVIEKFSGDGVFYCGILHTLRKQLDSNHFICDMRRDLIDSADGRGMSGKAGIFPLH